MPPALSLTVPLLQPRAAARLPAPPPAPQVELAEKNAELEAATREAEALLASISESTALAEKEKAKVAVIVQVRGRGRWVDGWLGAAPVGAGLPALAGSRALRVHGAAVPPHPQPPASSLSHS